jgi:THO complex subunit 4
VLNYNEKGQFKGIATIIFKSSKSANLAVEKYNGAPIDGGSSKLKLELIVDPTMKPLATRITANKVAPKVSPKIAAAKKQLAAKKKAAKKDPKKKPAKKAKKSVEELDQEMADYFESN